MAELLKREHDIVVLKVELIDPPRQRGADPEVRLTLQGRAEGHLADLHEWHLPLRPLGLDALLGPRGSGGTGGADPELPDAFVADLRGAKRHFDTAARTLWVHLVKPYGALRFLPWERQLVKALEVPVLMLPDFIFPRPREATASLEVAVCASAPGAEGHGMGAAIATTVRSILSGSPRRTRVQVFTDADIEAPMRGRLKADIDAGRVLLHRPADAAPFVEADPSSRLVDRGNVLRSPWLLWMRHALRARAVDVVHFCCHGHLTRGRGALRFAQSPLDRSDTYLAGPVGAIELQTFLTQVGAWSTAFEALPDSHGRAGLRGLADEIAQARPGPMLMHDLREDGDGAALAAAYAFIYAPQPLPPPRSPAIYLYCQPYLSREVAAAPAAGAASQATRATRGARSGGRIAPPLPLDVMFGPAAQAPQRSAPVVLPEIARNAAQADFARAAETEAPTDALFGESENAAPWLATTERFADDLQLHYQTLARDELMPEKTWRECGGALEATLQELRAAVADLSTRRGGGR